MKVETIRTEGLGDSTYVLIDEGMAIVVDPQRDIDRFETVLDESGAELRMVLETHLHNDYISGGRDLAKRHGGEHVLPAGAAPVFKHRPAFHLEDMQAGRLVVRPLHTPGHTPEHTSYLILADDHPVLVFSGGSLLVGSAGRSDLLGEDRADGLARLQYASVERLASLPDEVGLYPTHGAGSFCTTSVASSVTSTIGAEKANSPVLSYPDEGSFVAEQLSNLVPYPSYYRHMGPANLIGPPAVTDFEVPRLTRADYEELDDAGVVVDARPKEDFAAGHLAGSLAVELRDDFGTWVGWVVDFGSPLTLVMNERQDAQEAVRQLSRIGFDNVQGVVTDLSEWESLVSHQMVAVDQFTEAVSRGEQILDVRAPNERQESWITGSTHRYVPDLVDTPLTGMDETRPLWLACGTGYRANIAASLLEKEGFEPIVLTDAGVIEVLEELSKRGSDRWHSPATVAN